MTIEHKEYEIEKGRYVTVYYDENRTAEVPKETMETILIPALQKERKYRWHDLRKDPDDLPNDFGEIEVCWIGGSRNWYDCMFFDREKMVFYVYSCSEHEVVRVIVGDERYPGKNQVIAWRYIEPFEEG